MTAKTRDRCDVCGMRMSDGQIAAMNQSWREDAKSALETLRSSSASRSQRIAATTAVANIIEDLSKREQGLAEALEVSEDNEILPAAQKLAARVRELEAFNQKMAVVLLDASNAAFRAGKP